MDKYKEKYIKTIDKYHDILRDLREKHYDYFSITEYDSVYQDILDYEEDHFDGWYTKDFIQFINYLEKLTQVKKEDLK